VQSAEQIVDVNEVGQLTTNAWVKL